MADRIVEAVRIARSLEQGDAAVLISKVLAVHERQIEKHSLILGHVPVETCLDGLIGDLAGLGVIGIGAAATAEDVARHLIEKNDQGERTAGILHPMIEATRQRILEPVQRQLPAGGVEFRRRCEPKRPRALVKPEARNARGVMHRSCLRKPWAE